MMHHMFSCLREREVAERYFPLPSHLVCGLIYLASSYSYTLLQHKLLIKQAFVPEEIYLIAGFVQ